MNGCRLRRFWQELSRRDRDAAKAGFRGGSALAAPRCAGERRRLAPPGSPPRRGRERPLIERRIARAAAGDGRFRPGQFRRGAARARRRQPRHRRRRPISTTTAMCSVPSMCSPARALPGLPPATIDGQRYGGAAVSVAALDEARPADTLCFVIDGYDPTPGSRGGISRSAREIAALRRNHDLRRMIALLGERVPAGLRGDPDIRKCLAEASEATMTILHLVHEGSAERSRRENGGFLGRCGAAPLAGRRKRCRDQPRASAVAGAAAAAPRGRRARAARRGRGAAALSK